MLMPATELETFQIRLSQLNCRSAYPAYHRCPSIERCSFQRTICRSMSSYSRRLASGFTTTTQASPRRSIINVPRGTCTTSNMRESLRRRRLTLRATGQIFGRIWRRWLQSRQELRTTHAHYSNYQKKCNHKVVTLACCSSSFVP